MQPVAIAVDPFLVVGIKIRTTNRIEAVAETAKIPGLWSRFLHDDVRSKILEALPDAGNFAVYTDYECVDCRPYTVLVGSKVRTVAQIPQGMKAVTISGGSYLRFAAGGLTPGATQDAWMAIRQFFEFSTDYARAYTTDFEMHRPEEVSIFVAVK